jgi:hypothetical protein
MMAVVPAWKLEDILLLNKVTLARKEIEDKFIGQNDS